MAHSPILHLLRAFALGMLLLGGSGCTGGVSTRSSLTAGECVMLATDPSALAERDRLLRRVDAVRTQDQIPAIGYAIIRNGKIAFYGAAGFRQSGNDQPVGADDRFEIASGTKAFTATLVGLCVQEGRLTWDTPIFDVFQGDLPGLDPGWRQLSVRRLLMHRSGLSEHVPSFLSATADSHATPRAQRAAFTRDVLLHSSSPTEPQGPFEYRNINYMLLAAILEKVMDQPYERLIREKLFTPLCMESGGFGAPAGSGAIDQPLGHGGRRIFGLPVGSMLGQTSFAPTDPGADYPPAGNPAGMAHVNMHDWARFVLVHLESSPVNPSQRVSLLSADTIHHLQEGGRPSPTSDGYAGGWVVGTRSWARGTRPGDTGRVLYHAGDNGRWSSVVWIAPEIDFAMLFACNRGDMGRAMDDLAGFVISIPSPPHGHEGG